MSTPRLRVRDLTLGYGSFVLMRDVNFDVAADDIFLIMGGSGCGKSSLLRTLMGLKQPQSGQVLYGDTDIWACTEKERPPHPAAYGRPLPGRRPVELHDPGRERGPAAAAVHRSR